MLIFRDKTGLAITPSLWGTIEKALADSEYFLLMASPESAASGWVRKEVDWWMANRSASRILILLTDGEIGWNPSTNDFDWSRTTSLPRNIRGFIKQEPLWVDLRWARTEEKFSLRHSQFRAAILDTASTLLGQPKESLDGEDVRVFKRNRLSAYVAVIVSLLLAVSATTASVIAFWQQALAHAREMVAASQLVEEFDPELSVLLAAEGVAATWPWGHQVLPEAEQQLHASIFASRVRRTLKVNGKAVFSVAWSPDGKRLATGSGDGTARVWQAETGTQLQLLTLHKPVSSVAWSPDSLRLATGSGDNVTVWEEGVPTKSLTMSGRSNHVTSVAWSPDGKRLAVGASFPFFPLGAGPREPGQVKVWDVATGTEVRTLSAASGVSSVAWRLDGKGLATGSYDGTAKVWDVDTGRELLTLKDQRGVISGAIGILTVAWSPDGKRLAVGRDDGKAQIWNADNGEELLTLFGHSMPVESVAWSPDGRLATADFKAVKVWDAGSGHELLTLKPKGGVRSVVWSPPLIGEGERLATGSPNGTVNVWDAGSNPELLVLNGARSPAWSPDGKRLATASGNDTVTVWDASSGNALQTLRSHSRVTSVDWQPPDGKRLATGNFDTTANVWDVDTGMLLVSLRGCSQPVTSVAWSPDGKRLAAGSANPRPGKVDPQDLKVWDVQTDKELLSLSGHNSGIINVAWRPGGQQLASAGGDGSVVWEADKGKKLLTLGGPKDSAMRVAWSPDGGRLATDGADGTLRIWDASSGKRLLTISGAGTIVYTVAWSPNGKRLSTGSSEPNVKMWDARNGKELFTLSGPNELVYRVAWSPDGKQLAVGTRDDRVQVYAIDIHDLMGLARHRVTAPSEEGCKKYLHVDKCPLSLSYPGGPSLVQRTPTRPMVSVDSMHSVLKVSVANITS